jgi:hypothetical protein
MADKICTKCGASFGDGDDAKKKLEQHIDSFHPAGAPTPALLRDRQAAADAATGPTAEDLERYAGNLEDRLGSLSTALGDVKADVSDHGERLKALEEGTRSSVDLDVLVEQLLPRLQATSAATPPTEPGGTPTAEPEPPTYAELQAKAKELGIPATGSREDLEKSIAAEEAKTGQGT